MIVIDDPSGFACFLKSLATNAPAVKFCIVGVARDVPALMEEHGSVDRLFAGSVITLPPMSEAELKEITKIAEKQIAGYITFTQDGRDRIAALAKGHPYIVHLVGKYALRAAFQADQREIDSDAIDSAIRSIAERNAGPVLESNTKTARPRKTWPDRFEPLALFLTGQPPPRVTGAPAGP